LLVLSGCSGTTFLMPTPNIYSRGDVDPFPDVSPELQNNKVEVLYFSDRTPRNPSPDHPDYGYGRSRSVGFGVSEIELGHNVSWNDLVKASRSKLRFVNLPLNVNSTTELGRFEPTPPSVLLVPGSEAALAAEARNHAAEELFRKILRAQLSHTRLKEVYIFVHGYANTFDDSVLTVAELWHFFGRQGVAVAYSWPAGHGGLLRGYTYDRESSEFTVYHFKQMLRLIASCPEVKKIHIIGHSRGTQVVASGLEELELELHAGSKVTRDVLKLGTVVLAAPDLDMDVVMQRMATAKLGRVPEDGAVYINSHDKALELSSWLFGGISRLGDMNLNSGVFSPAEVDFMRKVGSPQIIDCQILAAGFGHDYFHSNPAVSSDLILLMRYHCKPGAENGRPLEVSTGGFWLIKDGYPGSTPIPGAAK
jgi:esterase/lipase superfamily enzyme